jgi:hypothetical protein
MSVAHDIPHAYHTKRNRSFALCKGGGIKYYIMSFRKLSFGIMLALLFVAGSTGCKKVVEESARKVLLDLMTNGRWMVQTLTESGVDYSTDYSAWEFQFYENGTVDGLNGTQKVTGTWEVDEIKMTIRSTFPTGSPAALLRLSETWNLTKTTFSYVEAKPSNTVRTAYLKLVRK